MARKQYSVTGEYVTFKTMTVSGMKVIGLYKGAPVPSDVPQESIDHHLNMGLIEEVPQAAEPKAKASDDDAKAKAEADAKAAHAASAGHTGAKGG